MERMLFIETPVGKLGITASDEAVTRIFFCLLYTSPSPRD